MQKKEIFNMMLAAFFGACIVGLLVGMLTPILIPAIDSIWTFLDRDALIYVNDQFEPYRVSIFAAFFSSFATFVVTFIMSMGEKER